MPDNDMTQLTRRRVLTLGGGLAAGSVLWAPGTATAAAHGRKAATWTAHKSSNGWPVVAETPWHRVEGAGNLHVHLAVGAPATVLLYVLRRYCYEIEMLSQPDVRSHSTDKRVHANLESNRLSGTAVVIKEPAYPLGAPADNGMSKQQITVIQDILADCENVVSWGGEMAPIKQSHFQIDVPPHDARLKKVVAKLSGWQRDPGQGAGTINAFAPDRMARSRKARTAR